MVAGVGHARRRGVVTLAHVADAAGVSLQTVSNVINAPDRVRPETRTRVEDTITALGYRPNRHARSLRTRQSRTLGYRVEQPTPFSGAFLDRFLHVLVGAARGHDYVVLVFDPPSADETGGYADLVRTGAVDAFALTDTHHGDRRPALLRRLRVPFVSFGRPWRELATADHPWVDVDGAAGTADAVRHLYARGRRLIAFLGWPEDSDVGEDRLRGWTQTCRELGLTPGPALRALDDPSLAAAICGELLDRAAGERPDAFVCASDTLAAGVYRALIERSLIPGADVGVVGFDDAPTAGLLPIPLTTVNQPIEQVAAEMVRLLDSQLRGTESGDTAVLLTPTLTVRQSA